MADKGKNKVSTDGKKPAPVPPPSQSPTLKREKQKLTKINIELTGTASQLTKGGQHQKSIADQAKASSKPVTQSKKTPTTSEPTDDTNKTEHDHAKTESDKKPVEPGQTDAGTSTDKAFHNEERTQTSPNPESQGTTKSQLEPKDLDLGKTITGVMDALGLLGQNKDAMEEYQALLKQQRRLEAQTSSENRKSWDENIDMLMTDDSMDKGDKLSGPLYTSLLELKQKSPEKYKGALKELTIRKKLVEDLQASAESEQRTREKGGNVTQIKVGKSSTNQPEKKENSQKLPHNGNGTGKEAPKDGNKPQADKKDQSPTLPHNGNGPGKEAPKDGNKPQAEKKDQSQTQLNNGNRKGNEAKKDDSEPTTESDQAKKGDNRRDPDRFRVMIPDGYQLIKSEELERMQYDLVNQRESIEELTSRLSAIASNKLKEGNPNIADLSDKNRPTKLGEQFAAMYDDQWSEAFEEMGKGDEEDEEEEIKSIEKLLDVVKESYRFCEAEADHQLQKIALGMKDAVSLQKTKQVAATVSKPEKSKKEKQDTDHMPEDSKSGTQSTNTAKKGMNPNPVPLSGQDKSKSDATSVQSGPKSGEAGGKAGQKPGATGGQSGPKPGATGGQSGPKPGATGGLSGQKPEPTDVQSGQKPGTTGGLLGQKPGAIGGQTEQKPGATEGQSEKNKSSSSSGSPNKTPPATPPNKEKNGKTAEEKVKSSMSETWHIALRCARSFRKETAMTAVTQIKQLFKDNYIPRMKLDPVPDAMSKYIDRCVELMWLMAVQDPPMEIKWAEHGDRSDTNYFKFYQSKGKVVRQCVWPAVFLSANGGIVSKGYIIGMTPPPPDQVQKKKAK